MSVLVQRVALHGTRCAGRLPVRGRTQTGRRRLSALQNPPRLYRSPRTPNDYIETALVDTMIGLNHLLSTRTRSSGCSSYPQISQIGQISELRILICVDLCSSVVSNIVAKRHPNFSF